MKGMLSAICKKHIKLLISVAVIASLGFGMTAGLICGYDSLERSLNDYVSDYNYPDAVITTEVTTAEAAERLRRLEGISGCDPRLFVDTTVKDGEGKNLTVRAFSYSEDERQGFVFWSKAKTLDDTVLVEFKFAESNDIRVGDRLSFRIEGEYRDLFVGGIVSRPETLAAKINDDSWGINYDFGYVYVPVSLLEKEYEKDYAGKKAELDKKTEDLENETDKAFKLLDEKQKELDEAIKLLEEKKSDLADAKKLEKTLSENRKELAETEKTLDSKKTELEAALALIDQKERELISQRTSLNEAKDALRTIDETLPKLRELENTLNNTYIIKVIDAVSELVEKLDHPLLTDNLERFRALIAEAQKEGFPQQIDSMAAAVAEFITDVDTETKAAVDYLSSDEVREMAEEISLMDVLPEEAGKYKEFIDLLEEISGIDITTPIQLKEVYDLMTDELAELRSGLEWLDIPGTAAVLRGIDTGRFSDDLSGVLKNVGVLIRSTDTSGKSLAEIYQSIISGISDAVSELSSKRSLIVSELAKYGVTENGIDTALDQISDGLDQCSDRRQQAQNGLKEIEDGLAKTAEGIKEIDSALKELREKLDKGSSELDDAEKDIRNAEDELEDELSRRLKERSEIEEELRNAYKLLDENTGYGELCNEFQLYFEDGADPGETLERAVASFKDVKVKSSVTYEDSAVKKRIDENLDPIRTMMVFLPVAFFVIVLIVIFLFMSMIIKQSRREIGILRALGFTRGQVRRKFCTVSLMVCAAGMIPGVVIAAGLSLYVGNYFKDFFPLPDFTYEVGIISTVMPAAATAAVTLTATLLSTGQISRIMPDEAMSRQVRTSAKIPAILRPIINRLRPMAKVTVTSLMRSKGRFVISTVCIAASAMLILTAFSFISSKNYTLHQVFDERIKYDCQIFFEETPSDDLMKKLKALGYIEEIENVAYYQTDISAGEKSKAVVVNAIEEDSGLIGITDGDGKELKAEEGGIVLERHTAEELGVDVGGTVTVKGKEMTVTAVSDQCVNRIQNISYADAASLPKPDLGCLVCTLSGDCKQEFLTFLFDTDGYQYSVFTASLYDYNTQLYATYDLAALIVIMFAVTIGFVIVLNTMLTNLYENKKELAILRTLGFQHREISLSRLSQAMMQFVLACLIGFPPGALLARAALVSISTPLTEYVYVGGIFEYLFTAGIILLYLIVCHLFSMRSMKKWDVTEVVKDKE
ncbi:MAG: FtsX-like permease family protein [Ruminococcus sp.]|nr:FtsX-like permease family protein [Ruminococcus sp.]